jgi:hypothetical protein
MTEEPKSKDAKPKMSAAKGQALAPKGNEREDEDEHNDEDRDVTRMFNLFFQFVANSALFCNLAKLSQMFKGCTHINRCSKHCPNHFF